ncbi:bleomycin resistance protein [Microcella humidisoli]|uniref:Bleomycin resistance protein n=1 Tax=Microcella humidisoli TaxID=2963406 RepID=A0ABY5FVA2_9MICO|nr:bleomycin resistance protein [Microcella humidisoli]UTT62236.1 bleomycin resistance protein [Microcella humidisoli]
MADHAVPTLPSRDLDATAAFYKKLGFVEQYRDAGWLIMSRGDLTLEFFPHPDLDPSTSDHQANLRVDDLDALHAAFAESGVPLATIGIPRLTPIETQQWGARAAFLIDLDGTMLRLIEN